MNSAFRNLPYNIKQMAIGQKYRQERLRVLWWADKQERDLYFVGSKGGKAILFYETRRGEIDVVFVHPSELKRPRSMPVGCRT